MVKKPSHSDNGFFSRTPLYRNTQFLLGDDTIGLWIVHVVG
jgi:hypothetical protein